MLHEFQNLFRAVLILFVSTACAFAQDRHALVVGVDKYVHVVPLQKARNDANAIDSALQQVGFQVTKLLDPTRRELNQSLSDFAAGLQPGDEALFYFAGHGIEVAGRNYLLPADIPAAQLGDEDFVIAEAIGVNRVLRTLQRRGVQVSVLILDACRDNPFPTKGTRSLGSQRGLARVDPPEGAFILYSAGTGQAALDRLSDNDPDPNSVFTRALVPRLLEPGLNIHSLAREVRRDVRAMAKTVNHDQFPAYYDQLAGVFSFHPDGATPPAQSKQSVVPVPVDPCSAARADWAIIADTSSQKALELFVEQHAACAMITALARERLKKLVSDSEKPTLPVNLRGDRCGELWFKRNLIFHNHGFCFRTERAKAVFDVRDCTTRDPQLTFEEQNQVRELQALERQYGC